MFFSKGKQRLPPFPQYPIHGVEHISIPLCLDAYVQDKALYRKSLLILYNIYLDLPLKGCSLVEYEKVILFVVDALWFAVDLLR